MTAVKVSRKGGISADGNMRLVGSTMSPGRDAIPNTYQSMISGQHYLYNVNLNGNVGDKMVISFTNATPSSVNYPIIGQPGTTAQMNRDILLLVQ